MISEADIAEGGRLADKIDEMIRFIAVETDGDRFKDRQDRENAARRLLNPISAEDYVEHVADTQLENHEERVTIQVWANDLVKDLRLQGDKVVVSDVLNDEDLGLLERFSDFCAASCPPESREKSKKKRSRESDTTPLVVLTVTRYFADHHSRNAKLLEATPGIPQIVSLEKLRECPNLRAVVDHASSQTAEDNVWTIAIDLREQAEYDDTFMNPKKDFLTNRYSESRASIRKFIDEVYDGFSNDDDDDDDDDDENFGGLFESKREESGTIAGKMVIKM